MKYQITYRSRASKEYIESVLWYKERGFDTAENFVRVIDETINKIAENPLQSRNTYKCFYERKTMNFPFSIVYFIDEDEKRIVIISIFHFKRNPRKNFTDND